MLLIGCLILLLPLTGAVVAGAASRRLGGHTHWVVIAGVGGAALCAFAVLARVLAEDFTPHTVVVYNWISAGVLTPTDVAAGTFRFCFYFDALTAVMLVTVTFISTLVVIYSRDYMRHHDHPERGYERFFAYISLFVFSMCTLVLGGNFLLLYLGWEAVGLCSYLLIGFYYSRPAAAAAAKKAFLVNRIGDFGFALGILLIYLHCGRLDYDFVLSAEGMARLDGVHHIVALLLLCGAVGKSAQLPLYVWLPDAMEGPSPVSALIHAATMVTAGIYMIARCGVIFAESQAVMTVVAVIGGATALFAATIALAQYDMKRILAYSTVSQLGYMFLGLGVYAADAAVFHLFTHAFFKALLFLAAGSVMHAMGGIIDLRQFSGLRRVLPWTFRTFVIGAAALAGVPYLFSAFYSKDLILHRALEIHPFLGWLGIATAALTALYTFRMVFLAFWGERRLPPEADGHESGVWMIVPLLVLSVGAIGAGVLFHHRLPEFLAGIQAPFAHAGEPLVHHVSTAFVALISSVAALGGIAVAAWYYLIKPGGTPARGLIYQVLYHKYYVDELYDAGVVRPLRSAANLMFNIDRFLIDGLVWLVTAVPRAAGYGLRGLQRGALQGYAATMATGFGLLLIIALYLVSTGRFE